MNSENYKTCDFCGLSFQEISEKGWFGCARCYEVFADCLPEILESSPAAQNSTGNQTRNGKEMQSKIKSELARAVALEEYELAAELRDRLQECTGKEEDEQETSQP